VGAGGQFFERKEIMTDDERAAKVISCVWALVVLAGKAIKGSLSEPEVRATFMDADALAPLIESRIQGLTKRD